MVLMYIWQLGPKLLSVIMFKNMTYIFFPQGLKGPNLEMASLVVQLFCQMYPTHSTEGQQRSLHPCELQWSVFFSQKLADNGEMVSITSFTYHLSNSLSATFDDPNAFRSYLR
jgi:hypothetical protein